MCLNVSGRLLLVDFDMVEVSNIHRQIAHTSSNVGIAKVASLAAAVKRLNPLVDVVPYLMKFDAKVAGVLIQMADVVIDACDNISTRYLRLHISHICELITLPLCFLNVYRYLLNDACVLGNKPLVSGAAQGMDGQVSDLYRIES